MGRKIIFILVAALALLGVVQTSQAAVVVSQVTPTIVMIDPANGFPVYYDDGLTKLVPCQTENPAAPLLNPYCVLLADPFFDAVSPIIFPTNYPIETFYFIADADTKVGLAPNVSVARFAIEGSFANNPPSPVDG